MIEDLHLRNVSFGSGSETGKSVRILDDKQQSWREGRPGE